MWASFSARRCDSSSSWKGAVWLVPREPTEGAAGMDIWGKLPGFSLPEEVSKYQLSPLPLPHSCHGSYVSMPVLAYCLLSDPLAFFVIKTSCLGHSSSGSKKAEQRGLFWYGIPFLFCNSMASSFKTSFPSLTWANIINASSWVILKVHCWGCFGWIILIVFFENCNFWALKNKGRGGKHPYAVYLYEIIWCLRSRIKNHMEPCKMMFSP